MPLARDYLVRDLARDLGLPIVAAASPGLGTTNHTLLTLAAARSARLRVAAVVLTPWAAGPFLVERSNRETIERLGGVAVETLPWLDLTDTGSWPPLGVCEFEPAVAGLNRQMPPRTAAATG